MRATEQILIRRLCRSDAESFCAAVRESIDELSYWMPWCRPDYALDDAKAWIGFAEAAWASGSEYPLGIFDLQTGSVIGGTGVNHVNRPCQTGNLGYWVRSGFTGRGIARSAARLVADIGFRELGLTRLEIVVLTPNRASQRVAEAIGATKECHARNRLYFRGKPHEAIVYSLVPEDLPSLRDNTKHEPVGG